MIKKRLEEIDCLRGLAIIGVVAIHTILYGGYDTQNIPIELFYTSIVQLSTFSVPLFIFVSGLVLTYNYFDTDINYVTFIEKRFGFVLIPYIFWSCIYILYKINGYNNLNIITILKKIIFGNAEVHLYFIVLIVQFYLLFPLILRFIKKTKKYQKELLILCFIFNLLIISLYYYQFNYLKERYMMILFIFWIFYFIFGSILSLNLDYFKTNLSQISLNYLSIIFFWVFLYLDISYFNDGLFSRIGPQVFRPQLFIYATLCIIIILKFIYGSKFNGNINIIKKGLKLLGKNSFGIYLSHILFLNISVLIFRFIKVINTDYYYNILLFMFVLIMSLLFVLMIRRLDFGRYIVGDIR